ncbi:biopolymer transport protein ExbD [Thermosulfidibacter takaii ABI70S6]|uniref:Biopolymer transport protein ExbD n=1 Tax=Thermosulfidibacter takaii (strain DSM 17441 / JCM 13301 / NBRC 103674 / ABI70S6) TaxID=1298851 RepID=A0A0S3QVY4_THET7|nr:biopolymer transporter ExbD [Thermosulfidibacter takaii]BAT72472.1 biopolymer transport protein ExbD [Thermosulfidibacter takaii ABI70S6]
MRRRLLSDINITPLVDVMLVLLIIFMVTAPMMKRGIVMDLPRAKATRMPLKEIPVVISIKGGKYFIDRKRVSLNFLDIEARKILKKRPKAQFVIEAERNTPFEKVVKVLAVLRGVGITRIGIATLPEKKGK